jgi:hypothetical protein
MNGSSNGSNAFVEHQLALAWRHINSAAREANSTNRIGLTNDLYDLALEIRRLQEDLLKSGKSLRTRPRDTSLQRVSRSSRLPF